MDLPPKKTAEFEVIGTSEADSGDFYVLGFDNDTKTKDQALPWSAIKAQIGLWGADFRTDITGATGGTASDLDSFTTVSGGDYAAGAVVFIFPTGGGMQCWVLKAGANSEDEDLGIVLPDDYVISTNEKYWERAS